jgi:hypothetical protein
MVSFPQASPPKPVRSVDEKNIGKCGESNIYWPVVYPIVVTGLNELCWELVSDKQNSTDINHLHDGSTFCRLLSYLTVNKHQQTQGADITERHNLAAL